MRGVEFHLRQIADQRFYLVQRPVGLFERAARGRGDVHEDGSHIFVGNQPCPGGRGQHRQQDHSRHQRGAYRPLVAEEPPDAAGIASRQTGEGASKAAWKRAPKPLPPVSGFISRAQSAGESVRALVVEMATATAIVSPNCM